MNETTNKYDNPILICIGSYKDFHDDGELFCGGCGYQYSPDEAEAMFKDVKLKIANTGGIEVHAKLLHCVRCCRQYEYVYFDELGEFSKIVPTSLFKNRYVTKHGELILLKKYELPLFIPRWDFNEQRRMSYADAIAYMLYSSLCPLGYRADELTLQVTPKDWEIYTNITRIYKDLHEDICNISEESLRCHLDEFDKILASMRDMENDRFFSIGGNEDER